jgi:hypothetical protein
MKTVKKSFAAVMGLIVVACIALAYVGSGNSVFAQFFSSGAQPVKPGPSRTDLVTIRTDMVQEKVLKGSDGQVSVSLTLDVEKCLKRLISFMRMQIWRLFWIEAAP